MPLSVYSLFGFYYFILSYVMLFGFVELVFDCVWMSLGMYEFGNQSYDILLHVYVLIVLPLGLCFFCCCYIPLACYVIAFHVMCFLPLFAIFLPLLNSL